MGIVYELLRLKHFLTRRCQRQKACLCACKIDYILAGNCSMICWQIEVVVVISMSSFEREKNTPYT